MKSITPTKTLDALTMTEAIQNGLTLIKRDDWREHQRRAIQSGWERWLKESKWKIQLWTDLRPLHIREFTNWMESQINPRTGKAWSRHTVSHYKNPLYKASEWVQLHCPDIWQNPFIRKMKRCYEPTKDRYLMPDQLATVIASAKKANQPAVVAALAFGGLAGLGIMELLDLSPDDIGEDTITIRREKNAYRPRVIPMCDKLKPYAQGWKACFAKIPVRGGQHDISKRARKVFKRAAKETGDKTFEQISLHEATRVTFANMAKAAGAHFDSLAAFLGHAPTSTLDKYYLKLCPRIDDLPRIKAQKITQLDLEVCKPLDKKLMAVSFFG